MVVLRCLLRSGVGAEVCQILLIALGIGVEGAARSGQLGLAWMKSAVSSDGRVAIPAII